MSHHQKPVYPQPPRDTVYLQTGSAKEAKDRERLERIASKQPFVSQVDILFSTPGQAQNLDALPIELRDALTNNTFQHARLNPARLLTSDFMTSYIRNGSLVALSCDDGSGDIMAIDGSGHLVLSLSKDTYELLGIVGNPSKSGPKGQRYYIAVDLREMHMRDGKPGYERLKQSLSKLGELEIMFSFYDSTDSPKTIRFPDGIVEKTLKTRISISTHTIDIKDVHNNIDQLQKAVSSKKRKSRESDTCKDLAGNLLDTIGLASLDDRKTGDSVASIAVEGFLHPLMIAKLVQQLQVLPDLAFLSVSTHTLPHSPVLRSIARPSGKFAKKRPAGIEERDTQGVLLDGTTFLISFTDEERPYVLYEHA